MSGPGSSVNNPFGVSTTPLEVLPDVFAEGVMTKTYHGLSIQVNGNVVGRIQSWSPQMYTRDGTHIYELGYTSYGRPVDYVPGPARNYTIVASRTEVWRNEMERTMGFNNEFTDLVSQKDPFNITEYLFAPRQLGASPDPVVYRAWQYYGCWFTEKNPNAYEAEGDAKMIVNATISFISRIRAF